MTFMHGEDCAGASCETHDKPAPSRTKLDDVKVHPASQPTALARTDEPSIHDVIDLAGARRARDDETCFL